MDMPWVTEKVNEYQRNDRLKEAEQARLFRNGQANGTFKLTVFLSGALLVAVTIVIVQFM